MQKNSSHVDNNETMVHSNQSDCYRKEEAGASQILIQIIP